MAFIQYLRDTQGELKHVAWPTRVQTIVYTILVVIISILVSLYLGFADYIFTTGLGNVVESLPQNTTPLEQPIISTSTQDLIISTTTTN